MTVPLDPYSILGVTKECQAPDIRKAYKLLALKFHPDKNQDADESVKAQHREAFDKIQSAYDILKDDEERARYDEKARLADLRKNALPKSNTSTPRTPKYAHYEVYTPEPRPNSFKSTPPPASGKAYSASYSRSSWEDERSRSSRYYEEVRTPPRREQTYSDKPSKREIERERERETREKEKEKERRRARKAQEAEEARKIEKLEKERRREERKVRDKQKSKDIKRETEEKRSTRDDAYIETFEEPPRPERKKSSSSRKHEEKRERERSSHRDDAPQPTRYYSEEPLPMPMPSVRSEFAKAYINRSRSDMSDRPQAYYRTAPTMPAVPTPPPAQASAFARPDEDDVRRSAARPRHHSPADAASSSRERERERERSHKKSSRERLDEEDPIIVNASPSTRRPPHAPQYATEMSSSPPRISRTNTMPTERTARPNLMKHAQTFSVSENIEASTPPVTVRGRHRSKLASQVPDELESDDYEELPRRRSSKHTSSKKKHRSPSRGAQEIHYKVDGVRANKIHSERYSRKLEDPSYYADYDYYDSKGRPAMAPRESSYVGSMKVKTSKPYAPEDIQYTQYAHPYSREVYT